MAKPGILCVANWDSDVGYAWWLMESFWVKISEEFGGKFEVHLAYPSISKIPESIKRSRLVVHKISFVRSTSIGDLLSQIAFIRRNKIKLIYFSDKPFFAIRYALFKVVGVKRIIVHDHTPGLRTKPHGVKKILKIIRSRIPFFNCDIVIGATEFVRKRCVEVACFPADRCFAAPNGIPVDIESCSSLVVREKYSVPEDRVLIVTTGRVTKYKGVDFALDVVGKMVKNGINIHYIYFGDGPDREEFEKEIKDKMLEEYVTFAGRVNCLHDILPQCDIAFHPSRGEVGYSLSILEYMRAGLPVVVPDNRSVCEATTPEKNGKIYKEGSIDDAVTCLEYLVSNPHSRAHMGEMAKKDLLRLYTLETCHHQLIKILSELLNCK